MKNKLYQLLEWKLTVSFIRLAIIVMDKSCNNKQIRGYGLNTNRIEKDIFCRTAYTH